MQGTNSSSMKDFLSLKYVAASFLATYFAGVVHPLDLIKTRFQSHDGGAQNLVPKYESIRKALQTIYKTEGLSGLYKGFYISIFSQAFTMSFFFWQYEVRKHSYEQQGRDSMSAVTQASIEASLLSTFITQPLWVIKTRMLLDTQRGASQFSAFKFKLREIYSQNGVRGFLKGLNLSLLLSFSGVIQMYTYQGSKLLYSALQIPESPLEEKHFFCGGLSKITSVMLSYPLTTLRTRIQQNQAVKGELKYKSVGEVASQTFRKEGIRGFYKGISANLLRGVTQKGIYFYCYEAIKTVLFPFTAPATN